MRPLFQPRSFVALAFLALGAACADTGTDEPLGDGLAGNTSAGPGGSGSGAGTPVDPGCEGPLGRPLDPSTLPSCCPEYGDSHCMASVPPELMDFAAPCDGGGYCVPDVFIETGGVYTPPACDSMIGGPGVCLSACIPAVAEQIALLSQDICAASERCVPCINPLDQMPTGACELAFSCEGQGGGGEGGGPPMPACDDPATCEYDLDTTCAGQPVADPSGFPACPASVCGAGGHCIPSAAIDASEAALLADCDGTSKCVPDTFIETGGAFTAATCDSVGGFEGRCLSACLPDVSAQINQLPQSQCAADQRCVPCFDPFTGADTGACSLSCDAGPTEPAQTFAKCCEDKGGGTCLPIALVGQEAADQLDAQECQEDLGQAGAVCVPDVLYEAHAQGHLYQPADCTTGFLVQFIGASAEGACLPTCIPQVDGQFGLSQSDCEDGFDCVPCTDQNGEDTGACHPQ